MNSWCKVENNLVVDGPRAWNNNQPPDNTWLPHRIEDPDHTINDKFDGSRHEVRNNEVVEVKIYSPKSSQQIADEIDFIKTKAREEVALAEEKLLDPNSNHEEWQKHKDAWSALINITELNSNYYMPYNPEGV